MKQLIEGIPWSRCSTERQTDGDTYNRQEHGFQTVLQRYSARGLFASTRFTSEIFRQAGSGYHGKHLAKGGKLRLFLDMVKEGKIGKDVPAALIIDEWSRFSRIPPIDALEVLKEIVRAGVTVIVNSPDMWVDNESVNGQQFIIIAMCLQMAHDESARKSHHQKAVQKAQREKRVKTGLCPNWLELVDGKYEKTPYWYVMEKAIKLAIDGFGVRSIMQKTGASRGLATQLRSRSLIGEKKYNNGEIDANHYPALITPEVFARLQNELDKRANINKSKGRSSKNPSANLFTDLTYRVDGTKLVMGNNGGGSKVKVLRPTMGAGGGLHYHQFENAILPFLFELKPSDVSPADNSLTREIESVKNELALVQQRTKDIRGELAGTSSVKAIIQVLEQLDNKEQELTTKLENLQRKASNPASDALHAYKTVVEMFASVQGEELESLRIKAASLIADLVKRITLEIHSPRTAKVTVELQSGEGRTIRIEECGKWSLIVGPAKPASPHIHVRTPNRTLNLHSNDVPSETTLA